MEEELRGMNLRLREWVVELERRTADISLLGQMADLLQSCLSGQEAHQVVAHSSRLIFPDARGALYLREGRHATNGSRHLLGRHERRLHDGTQLRGRTVAGPYVWDERIPWVSANQRCCASTLHRPSTDSCLCVPLMTKGEALGVYHLRFERRESREIGPRRAVQELAQAVAEHIRAGARQFAVAGDAAGSNPPAIRSPACSTAGTWKIRWPRAPASGARREVSRSHSVRPGPLSSASTTPSVTTPATTC